MVSVGIVNWFFLFYIFLFLKTVENFKHSIIEELAQKVWFPLLALFTSFLNKLLLTLTILFVGFHCYFHISKWCSYITTCDFSIFDNIYWFSSMVDGKLAHTPTPTSLPVTLLATFVTLTNSLTLLFPAVPNRSYLVTLASLFTNPFSHYHS